MDCELIGKILKTKSFEIKFDDDIDLVIMFDNVYVVLLKTYREGRSTSRMENNIYGVDLLGRIIWRIQDPRKIFPNKNNEASFTCIHQNSDNSFTATAFFAKKYDFNHKTRAILSYNKPGRWWDFLRTFTFSAMCMPTFLAVFDFSRKKEML